MYTKDMSGHSHWSSIKHKKGLEDLKRGKMFSKLARSIQLAVKIDGADPATNFVLRLAIAKAKEINMPKENIERAIERGAGRLEGVNLTEEIFEAYGPGGAAIIIEAIADNKNKTLNEMKQIFTGGGAKLADPGSVRWMFTREGLIVIDKSAQNGNLSDKEKLELAVIDAGAENIKWHSIWSDSDGGDSGSSDDGAIDILDVWTKAEELTRVRQALEKKGVKIEKAVLGWAPKEEIKLSEKDKRKFQKLFAAIDGNEAVQGIYSNLAT